MKHFKREGKIICSVCGRSYTHPTNLKLHYGKHHSKEELNFNKVPVQPIVSYNRKIAKKKTKKGVVYSEFEE